ncbi:hypothetical protein LCGC14_2452740, partial [marine sediment metagenome]
VIIMDKEYIKIKIENCKYLISNANSAAQKSVYEGYLKFWQKQIPKEEIESVIDDLTVLQKAEEFEVDEIYEDVDYEQLYKAKYPNRNPYSNVRNVNGKYVKTRAFKEFLKSFQ